MSPGPRPVIVGLGEVLWDVFPDAAHFGGAPANFACHAASLGAEAWVASAVGTDELGDRALAALHEHRVECGALARDPRHPTGTVTVQPARGGQVHYTFAEDTAWDHLAWSTPMAALAERCDVVCFGTLAQRSPASRETIQRFLRATREPAWRVFDVNLRLQFYNAETVHTSLHMASVCKLNDDELPIVARLCGLAVSEPRRVMVELAARFSLRLVALTRGAQGSLLWFDGVFDECPATPVDVVDSVGAGDSFTAALISDLWHGAPLPAAHRHASAVAAYVCSQKGATPPLPPHLRQLSTS